MSKPNFFLRTKLLPPRAVSEYLSRPRLTEKLEANADSAITMVAADAGCGKTTLIADFVRRNSRPTVWYQLDHTDADPAIFIGYITHGIKKFAPDFGETVLAYLTEATDEILRFPERAVDLLLNEILEDIEQPFFLVLDDYHHIGRETVVHKLVDRLLQYSSEMIHLIITTRDLPPLAIMRRRTQSSALIITRDDLLFTDDEVRELFRKTLNVELKDEEIAEYRRRTHGWITALQLVRQIAEQEIFAHPDAVKPDLAGLLQQSEKDIFDYFAEEVFSRETDETRNLMLHLSLLESMPADVCSRLFPERKCSALLPELLQKNVFLSVAGDAHSNEVYRIHPLFRDFLRRRLRSEIGRAGLNAERRRIADFFLAENRWEQAMPYFLENEDFETAARLIAENGNDWLNSGAITTLDGFIEQISGAALEKFPRALLYKAEIARLRGETEKSTVLLNRAVNLLAEKDDRAGEAEALHSLASLARRRGENETALAFLEDAEKLIDENSETFLKCANTRGLCLLGQNLPTQAEQQFKYALKLAEKQSNEHYIRLITHNLALPAGFRGDFAEALRRLRQIFRAEADEKPLPQEVVGYLNAARLYLYRGEFGETEKYLAYALELCRIYSLKALRGEIFETYGNFYREKNDRAHAEEFYERALKAFEEAGIDPAAREIDEERAKFFLERGDFVKARALLENLIEARRRAGNEIGLRTAQFVLCRIRFAQNDLENLAQDIQPLLDFFHEQNLNYDEAGAALLLAQVYYALDDRAAMQTPLQRALDLTARYDYEYKLRGEIEKNPKFFAEEEVSDKLPLDLRVSTANAQTVNPPAPAQVAPVPTAPVTDLTVKTFGYVEIYRDKTQPFASDAWTTKRARDMFCCIATSKHRRIDKEVLIDSFWSEEDSSVIEKNFHPTISHIRKALNSRQTFKQNFLIFRDGAYQLNPELTYSIDTEEFEAAIADAEKAKKEKNNEKFKDSLETARLAYRGEFMAGIYEDWAEEKRSYYAEQYTRVLNALAKIAFAEKKWSNAVKLIEEILQSDPYREDAHRILMKIYAAQGKRAKVVEHFENLTKILKNELGVSPAPETKSAYQSLIV